ncbi:MAG: YkgJ family cysteine cluster protein [Epsilonproteobacteria bacterium]|nr:YkgJ family cysteine cluster protein [Campylobacterota bacterium]
MRENIASLPPLHFRGCGECCACCEGKFILAPLIVEDFKQVYRYFDIRAVVLDEEVIPVMILTDGNSCKYLQDSKCTIYPNRPPACKIYPFSPYYDEIFIDVSCQAVGVDGKKLPASKEEILQSEFFDERLIDFARKRQQTILRMKNVELTFERELHGIKIYTFDYQNMLGVEDED